jgi:hypothetical protein
MRVTGWWRIVEMDLWDAEAIDLLGPRFIQFGADRSGHFGSSPSRGGWIAGAASATGARVWSSPGRATTRAIPPAAVAGRRWRRTGRCVGTSTSTLVTLGLPGGACRECAQARGGELPPGLRQLRRAACPRGVLDIAEPACWRLGWARPSPRRIALFCHCCWSGLQEAFWTRTPA